MFNRINQITASAMQAGRRDIGLIKKAKAAAISAIRDERHEEKDLDAIAHAFSHKDARELLGDIESYLTDDKKLLQEITLMLTLLVAFTKRKEHMLLEERKQIENSPAKAQEIPRLDAELEKWRTTLHNLGGALQSVGDNL